MSRHHHPQFWRSVAACAIQLPANCIYLGLAVAHAVSSWIQYSLDSPSNCCVRFLQVRAPTPNRDRVCQALTLCEVGTEYETVAPTATTNRVCAGVRQCTADQWISKRV